MKEAVLSFTPFPIPQTDSAAGCSWCPPDWSPSSMSRPVVVGSRRTKKPAVCLPPPRALQPPGAAFFLQRPQTRPRSKSSTCSSTSAAACDGLNLPRVAGLRARDRSTWPCRHSHSCHIRSWWRSILCNSPATKHPPLSTNRPRREAPREKNRLCACVGRGQTAEAKKGPRH